MEKSRLFPNNISEELNKWAKIKSQDWFREWEDLENQDILNEGFWHFVCLRVIGESKIKTQANYERPSFTDDNWLRRLIKKGLETIFDAMPRSDAFITPEELLDSLKMLKSLHSDWHEICHQKNAWLELKANEDTQWANKKPANVNAWIIDIIGEYASEDSPIPNPTPLTKILSPLLLHLVQKQLIQDSVIGQDGSCKEMPTQWHVDWSELKDSRSLKKWLESAAKKVNPINTTVRVKEVGKGDSHWILWIPYKVVPQIWVFNYGEDSDFIKAKSLLSLAAHPALTPLESEALEKLASKPWTTQNVKECISAFQKPTRNFYASGACLVGVNRPFRTQKIILEIIAKVVRDTKAHSHLRSLEHNLGILSTGWNWANGKRFSPNKTLDNFIDTWMQKREEVTGVTRLRFLREQPEKRERSCEWPMCGKRKRARLGVKHIKDSKNSKNLANQTAQRNAESQTASYRKDSPGHKNVH
ncbi:Oidioi.mRNA.OKI2018_I69.chrUn_4.g17236.t1.cds [Oikopleura dioica]|uniref:Oidioi.mRNA.OKI2018_I69.chrUn_4.g17236.t1.c ds n=1 Tax=Oikopleura dioica TaxID=34765 RepID=A0ABN7TBJ7_OIKDI|nr:Oidioi.mRNA.OKI2018_I69.chrUn_4.g17236.t1.cds [Oikopleura dioica]